MQDDGKLLRQSGIVGIGIAMLLLLIGVPMDIGVSVDKTASSPSRVANLSLMHLQAMFIQGGLGFLVAGAVLLAGGTICRAVAARPAMPTPMTGLASPPAALPPTGTVETEVSAPTKAREIGTMGYCPGCSNLRSTTTDKCVFCGSTAPTTTLPSRKL